MTKAETARVVATRMRGAELGRIGQTNNANAPQIVFHGAAMCYVASHPSCVIIRRVLETDFPKHAAGGPHAFLGPLDGPALNDRAPAHEGERCGCEGEGDDDSHAGKEAAEKGNLEGGRRLAAE